MGHTGQMLLLAIALLTAVGFATGDEEFIKSVCSSPDKATIHVTVSDSQNPGQTLPVRIDCDRSKKSIKKCFPPQLPKGLKASDDGAASTRIDDPFLKDGRFYKFFCSKTEKPTFTETEYAKDICKSSDKTASVKLADTMRSVDVAFKCEAGRITSCRPWPTWSGSYPVQAGDTTEINPMLSSTWYTFHCDERDEPTVTRKK